ncbi:hypothetical protein KEHDKFFH_19710 [Marinobacter maroccanus]|uniref:Uncharacterized protein n=1 Tax=Marinobacter maroccanus TaxID=2055143 RepID=A0A2S5Z4W7_9GAMM|nr:hypothetical protein [Marinobacter maroccanus]PPI82413.1 hypothetical protein KEHDKFFH_19710 [Marinobacter maroccanus]
MAKSFPDHRGAEDLRVYLDCAAIAMLMLSALTLVGVYGPYAWISPEDIEGVSGKSGLMFVAPLTGALIISGFQITSNRAGRNLPTAAEMVLFCALHLVAFLASYLAIAFFQILMTSMVILLIGTAFTFFLPAAGFIHIRRKRHRSSH